MSKRSPATRLPAQALAMFASVRVDYAAATDEEWDALREHLDTKLDVIDGGSAAQRRAIVAEFDRIRVTSVATRDTALLLHALTNGGAQLVRDRGDGLEEWEVAVPDGPSAKLLLPTAASGADAEAIDAARRSLLTGTCPRCGRRAELIAGFLEVTHNSRCAARRAQ